MDGRGHLLIVSHVLVRRHGGELYLQGGFGRHLDLFAERFDKVTILTCAQDVTEAPDDYRLRAQNVTVEELPPYSGGGRLGRILSMVRAAWVALLRLPSLFPRADVLHPRLPSMVGMAGALVSRQFPGPVVYYMAGDWEGALRAKNHPVANTVASVLGPLQRWMVSNGPVFTAGEAVAERLRGEGRQVIPVMTTALDRSHVLDPDEVERRIRTSKPKEVLFVGAVWKMKGAHHFLGALKLLRDRYPEIRARMIGAVKGGDWFEPMVDDFGLGDIVTHHPHMAWDRLMETYDHSDVFIMPSVEGRGEGVPKVALEAMARGVPVVASAVGGIPTLIEDHKNGLLVPAGNEEAIADAVAELWEGDSLRVSLARAGVQTALGFDLNLLIDDMTEMMVRA